MAKTYKKVELSIPNQAKYTVQRRWHSPENTAQDRVEQEEYQRQLKLSKR